MPREFLALNPGICHKMLFANLLTSISYLHYFCHLHCPSLRPGWYGGVIVAQC